MKRAPKKPGKKGAKRTMAKRASHAVAKHRASGSFAVAPRLERLPAGFRPHATANLIVPETATPVPAGKLKAGLAEAKRKIDSTLHELIETLTGAYEIKEIKVVASFSADGKFLGFGVGGEASIEITIAPCADESA